MKTTKKERKQTNKPKTKKKQKKLSNVQWNVNVSILYLLEWMERDAKIVWILLVNVAPAMSDTDIVLSRGPEQTGGCEFACIEQN